LRTLDHDILRIDETSLRLAFGGLLGIWALVRADGTAGMGFCPDTSSQQFGMSWTTGDVGMSLYQYIRKVASYVLPNRHGGVQTFGCHFEVENEGSKEIFVVRPWDGVGRRIVVRHMNLECEVVNASIVEMKLDGRKRFATFALENASKRDHVAKLEVRGLWGNRFVVDGRETESQYGKLVTSVEISAGQTRQFEIKVIG
jgi:hypothetical protein